MFNTCINASIYIVIYFTMHFKLAYINRTYVLYLFNICFVRVLYIYNFVQMVDRESSYKGYVLDVVVVVGGYLWQFNFYKKSLVLPVLLDFSSYSILYVLCRTIIGRLVNINWYYCMKGKLILMYSYSTVPVHFMYTK